MLSPYSIGSKILFHVPLDITLPFTLIVRLSSSDGSFDIAVTLISAFSNVLGTLAYYECSSLSNVGVIA